MTVLSVDEVMDHLNITTSEHADELSAIIAAAEAAVAKRVGPLEPTTVTSVVDCGGGTLRLPLIPVLSVTSATAAFPLGFSGQTLDIASLSVNGTTGVVSALPWGLPAGQYTVTYEAGRPDGELPADLLLAVKEMVRHLWKSQRGASARPGSADSTPPAGYLIPNAVAELLAPHKTYGFGLV